MSVPFFLMSNLSIDVKCQIARLWRRFMIDELDIVRFRLNEVNFDDH